MNRSEALGKHLRGAILLQACFDDSHEIELPSSSIVYVWGSTSPNDETDLFLARAYPPRSTPVAITLRLSDIEKTWDWDNNMTDTVMVPSGLIERVVVLCDEGFANAKDDETKIRFVKAFELLTLALGRDFDRDRGPIDIYLRKLGGG